MDSEHRSHSSDATPADETDSRYPYQGTARIELVECPLCGRHPQMPPQVRVATIMSDRPIEEEELRKATTFVGVQDLAISVTDQQMVYVTFTPRYAADPKRARAALVRLAEFLGVELTKAVEIPDEELIDWIEFLALMLPPLRQRSFFDSRGFGFTQFP